MRWLPGCLFMVVLAGSGLAQPATRPEGSQHDATTMTVPESVKDDFAQWVGAFRKRALVQGIQAEVYDRAFLDLQYNPSIIDKDRNQSEFTKQIWDYLDTAVSDEWIQSGVEALAEHRNLLQKIEARFGVDREIVVAVWGLESAYGAVRGDTPVIEAMATLAFDGRRPKLFENQLIAALRILQAGELAAENMIGSWAGAMGHTQFMPTSYLAQAQDFDGDGRRDIWGDDPGDALASTAAYLAANGWFTGQPWGAEVILPDGFDYALTGKPVKKPAQEWAQLGVSSASDKPLPNTRTASILLPAGHKGAAFMIFDNFRVLATYNNADSYVIAVGHFADRLRGGDAIVSEWPRDDRALTTAEKTELQQRLLSQGFDPKGQDGIIGPKSIAALQAYQASVGLVPDGYASLTLLESLR